MPQSSLDSRGPIDAGTTPLRTGVDNLAVPRSMGTFYPGNPDIEPRPLDRPRIPDNEVNTLGVSASGFAPPSCVCSGDSCSCAGAAPSVVRVDGRGMGNQSGGDGGVEATLRGVAVEALIQALRESTSTVYGRPLFELPLARPIHGLHRPRVMLAGSTGGLVDRLQRPPIAPGWGDPPDPWPPKGGGRPEPWGPVPPVPPVPGGFPWGPGPGPDPGKLKRVAEALGARIAARIPICRCEVKVTPFVWKLTEVDAHYRRGCETHRTKVRGFGFDESDRYRDCVLRANLFLVLRNSYYVRIDIICRPPVLCPSFSLVFWLHDDEVSQYLGTGEHYFEEHWKGSTYDWSDEAAAPTMRLWMSNARMRQGGTVVGLRGATDGR